MESTTMTPQDLIAPTRFSSTRRFDSQRARDISDSLSRSCAALQNTSAAISLAASRRTYEPLLATSKDSPSWWASLSIKHLFAGAVVATLLGLAVVAFAR